MLGNSEQPVSPVATKLGGARPNIVWIYCDELRTDALGCYGNLRLKLHTPNIDRLAATGARFDNHFCNSPVCVPSRVALLSGQYPEETGVYNNEARRSAFKLPKAPPLTFPQVFEKKGYKTANFGKIHVAKGMFPGETPGYEIFQVCNKEGAEMKFWQALGEERVQMIWSPIGTMQGGIFPDDQPYQPDKVLTNGLSWMEEAGSGPYLIRLSILQPHTPVLPPGKYFKLYADQDPGLPDELPSTVSEFEKRVAGFHALDKMDKENLRKARLCYYAQVAWVDHQVGRLLEWLEKKGQLENTLIIFGADHGTPVGDTGAFEKGVFSPTVHRVPLIINWPAGIKGGQVRKDICDSLDVSRTLFAAAGITAPASFHGRDLFSAPEPEAVFSTIGYGDTSSLLGRKRKDGKWSNNRSWPRRSCVRTSKYRLDMNMMIDRVPAREEDRDIFLADVEADPKEMVNLAGDPRYADVVNKLVGMLIKHAEGAVEVPSEFLHRETHSGG